MGEGGVPDVPVSCHLGCRERWRQGEETFRGPHRSPLCADTPPPDSLPLLLGKVFPVPAPGEMSPWTMMLALLLLPLSQAAPRDGTAR